MIEDRNAKKMSDLPSDEAKSHREWVSAVRAHLATEHQRWGEALFRNLVLGNTGGVAVVAALMGQNRDFAASTELKAALGAFIAGVFLALFAMLYEFVSISRRLNAWDFCMPKYLRSEITFGQLYGPQKHLNKLDWIDYAVAGLPLLSCLVGCGAGIAFLINGLPLQPLP